MTLEWAGLRADTASDAAGGFQMPHMPFLTTRAKGLRGIQNPVGLITRAGSSSASATDDCLSFVVFPRSHRLRECGDCRIATTCYNADFPPLFPKRASS
jgi:hypothetical protein